MRSIIVSVNHIITSFANSFLLILLEKKHRERDGSAGYIRRNNRNRDLHAKDYITRLPDDILCHIISLLPFQSAVQTALLSTPWKDMWKKAFLALVQDASFEDAVIAVEKFFDEPSDGKYWGFQFNFGDCRVLSVAIAPNNALLLDFSSAGKQEFARPFNWLMILEPNICCLDWPLLPPLRLIRVKSLHLISMSSVTKDAVSCIISSLPFLQSLTIEKCNALQSLQIDANDRLEKLIVMDCLQLCSLRCSASYLRSFRYRGRLVPLDCEISLGKEVDAMLDFRQGLGYCCNKVSPRDLKNLITRLRFLGHLTLCKWFYESFILRSGTNRKYIESDRVFWVKELWWIECSMERENVDVLLVFLKQCIYLERLYVTIDPKSYNMTRTKSVSASLPRFWVHPNLKFLKLEGFPNEKEEMVFARRLIPICKERPEIIAKSSDGTCWRHFVKVPKLEKNGKWPYRLKGLKNKECPDHIHTKYIS